MSAIFMSDRVYMQKSRELADNYLKRLLYAQYESAVYSERLCNSRLTAWVRCRENECKILALSWTLQVYVNA